MPVGQPDASIRARTAAAGAASTPRRLQQLKTRVEADPPERDDDADARAAPSISASRCGRQVAISSGVGLLSGGAHRDRGGDERVAQLQARRRRAADVGMLAKPAR